MENNKGILIMNLIYDDIIYNLQKSGGVSAYWRKLEDFIVPEKTIVYDGAESNIFYKEAQNIERRKINKIERYKNPKVNEKKPFVFHSSYYRVCKNKNAVNVTTLHDFTYEYFRHDFFALAHKIQKKYAVMHSDGVICISKNTLADLKKYYPSYKGKIKVIYHGYDPVLYTFKNLPRNKDVLFVGSRASYKSFSFTLKLLKELPDLTLKIIGGGELSEEEKNLLEENIPNRYEKLSFVSNEDLADLYNKSFALFYPSEYEGFGFPVIEAQACGCPVICQKKSSIPEVSGDKCIYVDSSDFNKSILEIKRLENKDFYENLQNQGLENVKRFSWENCIEETKAFYVELLENKEAK